MFERLRQRWHEVKRAKPGTRFQRRYEQHKKEQCSVWRKPIYLVVGTLLFLLGLVLLPAPGPGFLVIFLGAGMIAEESLWTARALDWLEVRLRRVGARASRTWKRASAALKAAIVGLGATLAAAAGWLAYIVLTD